MVTDHLQDIKGSCGASGGGLKRLLPYDATKPITRIADIVPNSKNAWVDVRMQIDQTSQQVSHTSCPECNYTNTAAAVEEYYCFTCGFITVTTLSCRVNVMITDNSGSVNATIYDNVAENLVGHDVTKIYGLNTEEKEEMLLLIDENIRGNRYIAEIGALRKKNSDRGTRYTVLQLHLKDATAATSTELISYESGSGTDTSTDSNAGNNSADGKLKDALTDTARASAPVQEEMKQTADKAETFVLPTEKAENQQRRCILAYSHHVTKP